MATSVPKPPLKLSKSPTQSQPPSSSAASASKPAPSSSSSLSSHQAMVELKSRILAALSKLSDRDTQQIAVSDLERIIRSLPADAVPTVINALTHDPPATPDSGSGKYLPVVARRESLRLLAVLCAAHPDAGSTHLPKIIAHIVRRLKDSASDSSVRDACRDVAGSLSALYLRPVAAAGSEASAPVVGLFVKPLFEAMGEQNKAVQAAAALCLAKVVECAGPPASEAVAAWAGDTATTGVMFQKLCPRICKLLGGQSFLAKGALLLVISSLTMVGAISPQNMQQLLQSICKCLENSDWATRKAAADTLCVLSSHSSHLIGDGAAPTVAVLEACRFDKVKPVRDGMIEALQSWKKLTGEDAASEDPNDGKTFESADIEEKLDNKRLSPSNRKLESAKDPSNGSSPTNNESAPKGRGNNIPDKAAFLLKKKAPSLTDKELNPGFFQKLETGIADNLSVEVMVPRKCLQSQSQGAAEEQEANNGNSRIPGNDDGSENNNDQTQGHLSTPHQNAEKIGDKLPSTDDFARDKWAGRRGNRARDSKATSLGADEGTEASSRDPYALHLNTSKYDGQAEGSFMNNKTSWLAIQRQLSHLERQQASLMNMLQDFMGGSHDSMVTLENRVRGLERVVEEMARDLAISSGTISSMLGFESPPGRSSSKYNSFHEYYSSKFGRSSNGRIGFAERFLSSDGMVSAVRGRDPSWRSESDTWDSNGYSALRNGAMSTRRVLNAVSVDNRSPKTEWSRDPAGTRQAWDKGQGPFRLGEGPSARSAWQASKDEATLEAIRVAGEDNGGSRVATRRAIPELDGEALAEDNVGQERGLLWEFWTRAMDSLHVGDVDSAYAEILSTGDVLLLMKLMEQTGPVVDQLSGEIANEVLHAVGLFLLEESSFDMALAWLQQLTDLVAENGADFLAIPAKAKKEMLLYLHEAAAAEMLEDWDGATPDQMMVQLASSWGINLQQLIN